MNDERNLKYAESLAKLIRCETVSYAGVANGEKFARFHELLFETFPLIRKTCEIEKTDSSLLFRWKGESDKNPICLMSHHDVVEAGEGWTHGAFSGEISDGKIWGRGTLDTKGSLFAMLTAVEELISEGYVPKNDIYIESASTEETDGSGADKITKELASRGIRFSFVLDEGGMIVHDPLGGCDSDFAMVGVGEKAYADVKFIAKSNGGHSSTPPKDTPLVRLGKFMAEADRAKCFDIAVNDTTCEMLKAFAPYSKGVIGFVFAHAKNLKWLLKLAMPSMSPVSAAMVRTTVAFTEAHGSECTNVLPSEAYVIGNVRASHHQGTKSSIKELSEIAKKYDIETVPVDISKESALTSTDTDGYRLVSKAIKEIFPGVAPAPYVMNGASDCRYFDRVSDCCLRFAPFKIDDKQLESIHGKDENLDITALSCAVDFYKYIIKEV